MRILLQRVNYASVKVDGEIKGEITKGVLLFVGITHNDTEKDAAYLAEKIANLRIFEDEDGKMVWDREGFLHFLNSAAGDQNVLLNKEELIGALMKIQRGEYQVDEEPEVPAKENPQEEVCDVQITPEQEIVEETLDLTYEHHRKCGEKVLCCR